MISSALVEPLVRPLIAGRRGRSALTRTARSSSALVISALAAFGSTLAEARPTPEPKADEFRLPVVKVMASELEARLDRVPLPVSSTDDFAAAPFLAVLPARFQLSRIDVLIPDSFGPRERLRWALDDEPSRDPSHENARPKRRAKDQTFLLFGSGVHRSALPA
ncbi:MAG: hypothetical protein HY791_23555 [Deltaproteobacteria bacterium]|nr:hypothetical protein [Deltaproteobacteria bacterium]